MYEGMYIIYQVPGILCIYILPGTYIRHARATSTSVPVGVTRQTHLVCIIRAYHTAAVDETMTPTQGGLSKNLAVEHQIQTNQLITAGHNAHT